MKFFEDCWSALLTWTNIITLSPVQRPLATDSRPFRIGRPVVAPVISYSAHDHVTFPPPHLNDPETDDFQCRYENLSPKEWQPCSSPDDRGCWLKHKNGTKFDIHTNYELVKPPGTTRVYNLTINRAELNQDGILFPYAQIFDDGKNEVKYPGPWIRACWGDTVVVNVFNNLTRFNGTTIHWHGIRQLNSFLNDGVNGVTQCPIAPGDSFTYMFETWQYGSSWYHSHYSLQYADGLVGPLTIYGPSSANWDEAKKPTLMTDWNHRSAFQDFSFSQDNGGGPAILDSILLNGVGNYAGMNGAKRYNLTFVPGKRYLMRIINTSIETAFVFSIDDHILEVMSSDFVPIEPYNTSSITVGIGQRYHIVAHAHTKEQIETSKKSLAEQNFWIRTIPADGCSSFQRGNKPDERQGIVRYQSDSVIIPRTQRGNFPTNCSDEDASKLHPIVKWQIGEAFNDFKNQDYFEIGILPNGTFSRPGDPAAYDGFNRFYLGDQPLWLNFSDPSVNHLPDPPQEWDKKAVVIPEDAPEDAWVWLLISGNSSAKDTPETPKVPSRVSVPAAHPIHLHGHDFVILQQSTEHLNSTNLDQLIKPNLNNPPRRDVALLPNEGFLLIAFKADNPGIWLMHCHIAFHASSGLALQILERQRDIPFKRVGWKDKTDRGCANWDRWFSNKHNLWSRNNTLFQDDSGI